MPVVAVSQGRLGGADYFCCARNTSAQSLWWVKCWVLAQKLLGCAVLRAILRHAWVRENIPQDCFHGEDKALEVAGELLPAEAAATVVVAGGKVWGPRLLTPSPSVLGLCKHGFSRSPPSPRASGVQPAGGRSTLSAARPCCQRPPTRKPWGEAHLSQRSLTKGEAGETARDKCLGPGLTARPGMGAPGSRVWGSGFRSGV